MKLLILLSVIAISFGDKLDRTYLPPANAVSAGGSPGDLAAPGLSGFGTKGPSSQPFGQQSIGQPSRSNAFGQVNQQISGQEDSESFNFDANRPSVFTSGVSVRKPSPVYGPAAGRPNQGNNGVNFEFGPSVGVGSQGVNQPLQVPNNRNEYGQQVPGNSFGSNAASPFAYSQTNSQNVVGTSSRAESERPQAAADRNAEILKYTNDNDGDRFTYSFETSNGISAEATGVASGGVKAQGGYSYTGDDGKAYTITYTADEQGYVPQGEHLPTPHPIPEEILRSIEKNAQAAAAGIQEGAYRPEEYESEDNSQGYSGSSPVNNPQAQTQFSAQQYNPPIDRSRAPIDFEQSKPQSPNVPTSQSTYSDRITNGPSNVESVRYSNKNSGPINQAQSQRNSGYQYSRPQSTQYPTLPGLSNQAFGTQPSQSRPQLGSQFPTDSPFSTSGNRQVLNTVSNGASRPESQNEPRGQDFSKPSLPSKYQQSDLKPNSNKPGQRPQSVLDSAQNYNQGSSAYQYQPGTTDFGKVVRPTFPNQASFPNRGVTSQVENQYQPNPSNLQSNKPSLSQQYQSQNLQGISASQNGFNEPKSSPQNPALVSNSNSALGFPNSMRKESAPIQAPYQYQQPSQPFNQNQVQQNSYKQPASNQGQISAANKPVIGSQTSYNPPIQSQFESSFSQNPGQGVQTNPSQIQGSRPGLPSSNRPEQFSGPRQPPSYNPEEGYKY